MLDVRTASGSRLVVAAVCRPLILKMSFIFYALMGRCINNLVAPGTVPHIFCFHVYVHDSSLTRQHRDGEASHSAVDSDILSRIERFTHLNV